MKRACLTIWRESVTWLTAYLFAALPYLALYLLTFGLTHYLTTPSTGAARPANRFDVPRLAVWGATGLGVVYSTYRVRRLLQDVTRTVERSRLMIQTASDGIVIMDRSGNYVDANDKASEMFGYTRVELLGANCVDTTPYGREACVHSRGTRVGGTSGLSEGVILRKDGTQLHVEASATLLQDGTIMGIIRDISERKRAQEALRRSEQKYRSLFDNNLAAVYRFTTAGAFLDCNKAFAGIFSYPSVAEVMRRPVTQFYCEPQAHETLVQCLRKQGSLTNFELHLQRSDGTPVWALANASLNKEDDLEVVQGTLIDITGRKHDQDRMSASLHEKEVLLKEIHHRVKNNLQIISSLLSLQADYIDDPRALTVFQESQERINSIALLHESLYKSEDLGRIDIARYIHSLANNLTGVYRPAGSGRIRLNVQVSHLLLDLGTAMPCALIITELLTNSVKYAFPDGREGEIYIQMASGDDARITLTVGDTGVGMPPGTVPGQSDSLGLQLVDTLVKQLKGTVTMSRDSGTQFQIAFTPQAKQAVV